MTKTCSVAGCKTNYRKKVDGVSVITNPGTVFAFPNEEKKPELLRQWVRFCNQKSAFTITGNSGICHKHFEAKFIKEGERKTLLWDLDPVPSNYCVDIEVPVSVLPTPTTHRKPPTDRSSPDQLNDFRKDDEIKSFADITDKLCPVGYKLELHEENKKAIFYKQEYSSLHNIPEVTEHIVIDEHLHVKLFKKSIPIPLPEWFRKGGDCCVKRKSILENFPPYIRNFDGVDGDISDPKNIPDDILEELRQIRYKKPVDRPKFSPNLLRYALLMYYTSPQGYKMLLEQFPFPSVSLLKKLSQGGIDSLKACKLLLDRGKMDKDVILLLDEMYLQKDEQYQGGRLSGADKDGKLFKGVMTFMIVSLKKSIPFVVKAIPETSITGKWLSTQIDSVLTSVHECGFQVRAVVPDNHATNASAFSDLLEKFGNEDKPNTITHPSKSSIIYLFYDAVHLMKNVRNNLLNSGRFIFPPFSFDGFYDNIDVPGGEISWKLLHNVYDLDQLLPANLRKARKLSYKTLHPGDNKQDVPLALNIFDRSTAVGITEYFPERKDATEFLKLIDIWWTICNSKQEKNGHNRLGNAAVKGDMKPQFLRKFADWIEEWQDIQFSNASKYTLSAQTSQALVISLRCTASLIEDLLEEGYQFVLTARFQTDPLERRFSRVRQMSGGRFLVGLREFECATRAIGVISLIKESVNVWNEDIRPENNHSLSVANFNSELEKIASDIDCCGLSAGSVQVAAVIAGYTVRKVILDRSKCKCCQVLSIATAADRNAIENEYLNKLSRGGLIIPSADLRDHISKSFAILDLCQKLMRESPLPERIAGEIALERNDYPLTFLCSDHQSLIKFINRTVVNIFLNNEGKKSKDKVRKDFVESFKQRQRKKQKKE